MMVLRSLKHKIDLETFTDAVYSVSYHLNLQALSVLEAFRGLDRDIEGSPKRWRKLVESECPERERLPLDWKKKNTLQRLIILRAMRPDRMSYALRWELSDS